MMETKPDNATAIAASLRIYSLPQVDFETVLGLQRRLRYEVSGERARPALIICEHLPIISVGREGSRAHILCEPEELRSRQWRIRWVNHGGGCVLHLPGQIALYPILPLDQLGLRLESYLARLRMVVMALLTDFSIQAAEKPDRPGIYVKDRMVAALGVAVRDWVSYFGLWINVSTPLEPYRLVRCGGSDEPPMTSLERERHGPPRPALVRQRLVQHFCEQFGFTTPTFFSTHTTLNGAVQRRGGFGK
jgi:lipoyl(octanoyl) transferase